MYLLFDIGGTNMRIATSDGQTISAPEIIHTNLDFNQAMELFKSAVSKVTNGQKIEAASGGIRALGLDKKTLANRTHLPLWVDEPLYDRIKEIIGDCPLYLENDAALAGLGEATHGAGKGRKIVAYMTISSGVGGTRIVGGRIDSNSLGFEPGHQIIDDEKNLEDFISGKALEDSLGQKPEEILDSNVWNQAARHLAVGLNNITVIWSPDIIILGGSVMQKIPVEVVKSNLKELLSIMNPPDIVLSSLGDLSGLYGALEYIRQKHS